MTDAGMPQHRRLRHRGWIAAPVLLIVLVLVTWATGGLRPVDRVPTAAVGQIIEVDPLRLSVVGAWVGDHFGSAVSKDDKGTRVLVVRVRAENLGDRYLYELDQMFRIDAAGLVEYDKPVTAGQAAPDIQTWPEGSFQSTIQPGIPADLLLVWHLAPGATVPASTVLTVISLTYRKSSLDDSMLWADPTPTARVPLTLQPAR